LSPQLKHSGWLVDLAQWFPKYGRNPNNGCEGSKLGRAEVIQTGVVYFQR